MRGIHQITILLITGAFLTMQGCTVKAVGDPNRPITINAHITIDVKGLEKTANSIENYVSGAPEQGTIKTQGGK